MHACDDADHSVTSGARSCAHQRTDSQDGGQLTAIYASRLPLFFHRDVMAA
jgi:hypothetical protein